MSWVDFSGVFLIGLLGAGHCVGMCGGFALMVGEGTAGRRQLAVRHFYYQLGKAITYVFIGTLMTAAGLMLGEGGIFTGFQHALAWIAGIVMVTLGVGQIFSYRFFGAIPFLGRVGPDCGIWGSLSTVKGGWRVFAIGWLNGFLPCGLVLGVLLYLASFHSISGTALGAFLFGMSTFPGLFLFGNLRTFFTVRRRVWLLRIGGCLLVFFGLLSFVRASPSVHHWFHENLVWMPGGGPDSHEHHHHHDRH